MLNEEEMDPCYIKGFAIRALSNAFLYIGTWAYIIVCGLSDIAENIDDTSRDPPVMPAGSVRGIGVGRA